MNSLCRKLKNRAGETISEVLIALLISSLGLVMLASLITASSRTIGRSREALEAYYSESSKNEGSITITLKEKDKDEYSYGVSNVNRKLSGKDIDYYYIP